MMCAHDRACKVRLLSTGASGTRDTKTHEPWAWLTEVCADGQQTTAALLASHRTGARLTQAMGYMTRSLDVATSVRNMVQ